MNDIIIEVDVKQFNKLNNLVKSFDESDDHATNVGIRQGLRWALNKLNLWERFEQKNFDKYSYSIDEEIVIECAKEFKDNYVQAYWNEGYARAIFTILSTLNLQQYVDDLISQHK